jgi:nucleoside-diphosphate-sugar epimerase
LRRTCGGTASARQIDDVRIGRALSKVLVTGATGFTGRYLAPRLAAAGYEVHGTTHGTAGGNVDGGVQLYDVDLTDAKAVEQVVAEVSPAKVVHLAAIAFVAHSDIAEMYRTNILGTRNLLGALASTSCQPDAVLIASSANVYGNSRSGKLDESALPTPANDYAVTKVAAENIATLYRDRLPLIVTRPFNYTGVGQSLDFVIPKIVDHARRRSPEIELGNLDVERDFSDVRAIADAYLELLNCSEAIGGTFNVCSGRHHSLREVIAMVEEISHQSMKVAINPAFVRRDEVLRLYGDNSLLSRVIGPLQMPPLKDTLQWMLEA